MVRMFRTPLFFMLFLIASGRANAAPIFDRDVRPILKAHCFKCHGAKTRKGGLDLRTVAAIRRGGESGETLLAPKSPKKSHLWQLLVAKEMPPKGNKPLSSKQLSVIKQWIASSSFQRQAKPRRPELSKKQQIARQVEFIFEVKCWYCHGKREQKGGLDLRTRQSALKGGKNGPAIIAGNSATSLLVRKIQQNLMPPHLLRYKLSIKPINHQELRLIRQWIDAGAAEFPRPPEPIRDDGTLVSKSDRQWWSFQPPRVRPLPTLKKEYRGTNFIDVWVGKRLQTAKLRFAPAADRGVLIRRLHIDLWGLPPTAQQVLGFVNDKRPDAYGRLVDRLLSSPRFGERWAQHWLDAAGYADSEGSTSADFHYPLLYQYRDYVVRSHNNDRPYDQFLLQQLAGDELLNYAGQTALTQEMRDSLIATGFLRMCIDPTTSPETNFRIDRHQVLADTVEIVSSSLLGLTMRCARCHSHKYDPIPQRDYYRFQAIFAAAFTPHVWVKPKDRYIWLVSDKERKAIRKFNEDLQVKANQFLHERNILTFNYRVKQLRKNLARVPNRDAAALVVALKKPYGKPSAVELKLIDRIRKQLGLTDAKLRKAYSQFVKKEKSLNVEIAKLSKLKKDVPRAHGLTDMSTAARPFYLAKRGVWSNRGRRVLPNVPAVLNSASTPYNLKKPESKTTGHRLALARWLINKQHPLTARVMVNRMWRHYFARGIVATVGDFGRTGTRPTHPELLDQLAVEFMNGGWSMKRIHRLIVLSRTYRQSSVSRPAGMKVDPENQLLWRMPLRRKDAETIRDSILQVSQQLNSQMYGPGAGVSRRGDGQYITSGKVAYPRSVYVVHRRSTPLTLLSTFDAPRMTTNCVQRASSNVVSQALILVNGETTERAAKQLAGSLGGTSNAVALAYQRILTRPPTKDESLACQSFLREQQRRYVSSKKMKAKVARENAIADLCLVLLNSAEFLYVD